MKLENCRKESRKRKVETKEHAMKRSKEEIKILKQIGKHNTPKAMGCSKRSSKRGVCKNTGLPQETEKKKPQKQTLK